MMHDDYHVEPLPGLPENLPRGENIIWQGAPDWSAVARRIYFADKVALYFVCLIAWRIVTQMRDGQPLAAAITTAAWLRLPAAAAGGLLALLSWQTARTTVYTITSERVVLRFGIALPLTINLPFSKIVSADRAAYDGDKTGEIAMTLQPGERIAYLVLWPHLAPWFFSAPRPVFRCIPDAQRVAKLLSVALTEAGDQIVQIRVTRPFSAEANRMPNFAAGHHLAAAE